MSRAFSTRRPIASALAAASILALSCSPARTSSEARVAGRADHLPASSAAPSASASSDAHEGDADEGEAKLQAILAKVSSTRQLPIQRPVQSRALSRSDLLGKLRAKMNEELPPGIIALQGESVRALGLVPLDYDFEAGVLALLQGRIAGLYDPDDRTMYLLDDLGDSLKEETLNHELVHALQDQSFNLAPLLKFKAGKGDRTTAIQTLVEGDATSAMFEVAGASSLDISEDSLRRLFLVSTRFSADGLATPSILQASLISPYTDGFAFVGALRRKGGWAAVDSAFMHLPETTEQVLHLDKFEAREPALDVPEPTLQSLDPGFQSAFVDSMGELGLRQMLEEWDVRTVARTAAMGWGGDRYVVARRSLTDGGEAFAVAFHIRMDTVADAAEVAAVFSSGIGKPRGGARPTPYCAERANLGPIAWTTRGADLAIVAGPYARRAHKLESASSCREALRWLDETMGTKTIGTKTNGAKTMGSER